MNRLYTAMIADKSRPELHQPTPVNLHNHYGSTQCPVVPAEDWCMGTRSPEPANLNPQFILIIFYH